MGCKTTNKHSIIIGMSKNEVNKKYPFRTEEYIITEPGQFKKGYNILFEDDIEFTLVFDSDKKLNKIFTSDQSYKLPTGAGVSSSFSEIKHYYKKYNIITLWGYGRYVEVHGGIRFGFSLKEDKNYIMDDERVEWIEFNTLN